MKQIISILLIFLSANLSGQVIMYLADPVVNVCVVDSLRWRIASGVHDQEQEGGASTPNSIADNSSDLELMHESGTTDSQWVALYFVNLDIPQGARIDSCHIQFSKDANGQTQPNDARIHCEDEDDATLGGTSEPVAWISDSLTRTTAYVDWAIPSQSGDAIHTQGPNQRTPNLKTIVQEVIDRAGWAATNALQVIFRPQPGGSAGESEFESYDGSAGDAPEIFIIWCE